MKVLLCITLLAGFVLANEKVLMVNGKKYAQPQGCISNLSTTNTLRIQNNLEGPKVNIYKDSHCQKLVNQVYKDQQTNVRGQSIQVDYSSQRH